MNERNSKSLHNKALLMVLYSVRLPRMGKKVVVLDPHRIYASMCMCMQHGKVIGQVISTMSSGSKYMLRLLDGWEIKWSQKCEKWWFCFTYYNGGIHLGRETFRQINYTDTITSLLQNSRSVSLDMHINLKHNQIQLKRKHLSVSTPKGKKNGDGVRSSRSKL